MMAHHRLDIARRCSEGYHHHSPAQGLSLAGGGLSGASLVAPGSLSGSRTLPGSDGGLASLPVLALPETGGSLFTPSPLALSGMSIELFGGVVRS